MAVLNIRVDDQVRDQLKDMADEEGITVSEYVRNLVMAAIVPGYEPEEDEDQGDLPAPTTMRIADRQVLSLLHRILAHVVPEDDSEIDPRSHRRVHGSLSRASPRNIGGRSPASAPSCPSATASAYWTSSTCSA